MNPAALPRELLWACRRLHVKPTRFLLAARVSQQRMLLFETHWTSSSPVHPRAAGHAPALLPSARLLRRFVISTSRFGTGQQNGSNRTPLGLHRIAEKVGAGQPIGTVFQNRQPVGFTWQGLPGAPIAHRILWLEGLEPGFNRGGQVDSHERYIYIHGLGNEPSLGRPASRGCIHLSAADLLPLFDLLPSGTLVWIGS